MTAPNFPASAHSSLEGASLAFYAFNTPPNASSLETNTGLHRDIALTPDKMRRCISRF